MAIICAIRGVWPGVIVMTGATGCAMFLARFSLILAEPVPPRVDPNRELMEILIRYLRS